MNFGRRSVLPRSTSTISNTSTGASTDNESTFGNEFEDEEKDKFKRKTRNLSEKKRRDQFNMLINELCSMVSTNNRKMDKSTVLKTTIAFLKNYQELAMQSQAHEIKEDWKPSFLSNDEFTQLMLEALDSFLLVFTQQGNILYASESISSLLGHLPRDLINRSLYDFIHDTERTSLHNLLLSYQNINSSNIHDFKSDENQVSFMCHLKRGAVMVTTPDIYEYVKVTGNIRRWSRNDENMRRFAGQNIQNPESQHCFCCTVQLQPCQLIREISNIDDTKAEFTSRHSFEWKFLFLDHRAPPIIGYLPFEVLGTSGYDYYHPDDLENLSACHVQLMSAGEGTSCFYRFLTKGQQWIWLKTRYFITYHQWNSKPEFIVCTHKVTSYADVRLHLRKDQGFDEEEIEPAPLENATPEKSSTTPSTSQASPTWSIQLGPGIAGSSSAGQIRLLPDRAETAEKPHSTLEELNVTTAALTAHNQMKQKQQQQQQKTTKMKNQRPQLQLPVVQQQMSLPQLLPLHQAAQLTAVQQPLQTPPQTPPQTPQPPPPPLPPPPPPPPQASPSSNFQQTPATSTQQQQQLASQQQQQQQAQVSQQQVQQQSLQQTQAQPQAQQQSQAPQQQQQQPPESPSQQQAQTPTPVSVQPAQAAQATSSQQPPPSQQQQQQQSPSHQQVVAHQSQLQLSPSTTTQQQQSQLQTPPDLSPHQSLTVPGMMMMMAPPPTIPTSDLETSVQVSSDLVRIFTTDVNQISTVINQGQPTLAVSGLSLPQGIGQTPTNLLPQLFMTPAQRQLHKQLQFKSQQLQQTILRQQEELRLITEELALAHQFMPIADPANSAGQMLMMNPSTFTSSNTEIPSTSTASQFNILSQPITLQQPVQQQFLPFQILPTSQGHILRQSTNSSTTSTHPPQ